MTREALIRELRKWARKNDVHFEVIEDRGKGAHCRVELGSRNTIIKSGELRPGYVALIKRQLGVD
jgi:hypothetical protein